MNKIRQSQCRMVLTAPLWQQQTWFSEVLQLLVSAPVCLSLCPNYKHNQGKLQHRNPSTQPLRLGVRDKNFTNVAVLSPNKANINSETL